MINTIAKVFACAAALSVVILVGPNHAAASGGMAGSHFQSRDVVGLDLPDTSGTTMAGAPELTQKLPSGAANNFARAGVSGDFGIINYRDLNAANRPSAVNHAGALTAPDLTAETLEPALMVLLGIALIAGVAWQRRQN